MAEMLSNTPFELDIKKTSVYMDYISSKPISFGAYQISIDMCFLAKLHPPILSVRTDISHDTASYSTTTAFLSFGATSENITEKLNTLVTLAKRIAKNNINLSDDVLTVMRCCIDGKTDYVLGCDGMRLRRICDILDVTAQYKKLLQNHINESERRADNIAHFTELVHSKFNLEQPDLQALILYIAFDPQHKPCDFDDIDTSFLDVNGPPIAIEKMEKSLSRWYDKAKHFAETQTLVEAFGLSLCQKKGK
jgi:hypothetical protein